MSYVFAEAMRQLAIKRVKSTAYHPQSQGTLKRFHLTLKSMWKTFCLEFQRDWDEDVLLAIFAVREVVQESLGFSPAWIVFGHTVHGLLKLLKESWLSETRTYEDLSDYVSKMRTQLGCACQLARENLGICQKRIKYGMMRGLSLVLSNLEIRCLC